MKKWILALVVFSLVGSIAFANIPPTWFLVKAVAAKKKGFKTLRVRSRIQSLDSSQNLLIREVFTVDYGSGKSVSRLLTDSGDEILVKEVRAWQGAGLGSLLTASGRIEMLTDVLKGLKLPLMSEPEYEAMKALPSPEPEAVFFSRTGSTITWTIGRKGEEPQLILEKDSFVPSRWLGEFDGKKVDYQFEKYRVVNEFAYPEQTTVFFGSQGYRVTADEIAVNADLVEPKPTVKPVVSIPSELTDVARAWHRWYR